MPTITQLLTAEEFAQLPNDAGEVRELVRGHVIVMNQPYPRHGQVCSNINYALRDFLKTLKLGHVFSNDAGIRTETNPDTVRGGDVWYISFKKVPPGPLSQGYLTVSPDLVFEVLSPSDRRGRTLQKVGEYLEIGVTFVCVVNPFQRTVTVHQQHEEQLLSNDDVLTFPELLPGFSVPVSQFFE